MASSARLATQPTSGLAKIIPLRASHGAQGPDREIAILERRVGPSWPALPPDVGRAALRLEHLLGQAPARTGADTPLVVAIVHARQLIAGARAVLELLTEEVAVLSEGLDADLGAVPFDDLDSVASAVLNLGAAPTAVAAWGRRAVADSAEVVLDHVGPALREARLANERLYARFTDHVWEVPADLLAAGRCRWRVLSRRRLRRQLRAASRTDALYGSLKDLAQEVVDARIGRARLLPMQTLVAHHLGELDRGVLTDVDGAATALDAVRRLQRALGDLHSDRRLERLLLADAFRSQEVLMPAWSIRTTLDAWASDVAVAGGRDALSLDGDTLARWVDDLDEHLPPVAAVLDGAARADVATMSLRQVVDALVLREQVASASGTTDASAAEDHRAHGADRAHEDATRWSSS